jgi:hypothetical protein
MKKLTYTQSSPFIILYVIILLVAVAVRALLLGEIAWCRENFG